MTRPSGGFAERHRDCRYLTDAADRTGMRHAARTAVGPLRTRALARLFDRFTVLDDVVLDNTVLDDTVLDGTVLDDDDRLDEWMSKQRGTAMHMCGSAPWP